MGNNLGSPPADDLNNDDGYDRYGTKNQDELHGNTQKTMLTTRAVMNTHTSATSVYATTSIFMPLTPYV